MSFEKIELTRENYSKKLWKTYKLYDRCMYLEDCNISKQTITIELYKFALNFFTNLSHKNIFLICQHTDHKLSFLFYV